MGYSTDFDGYIIVTPPVPIPVVELWNSLAMSTELRDDENIVTQWPTCNPGNKGFGFHCQWELIAGEGRTRINWDGGEKFYDYAYWLQYLVNVIRSEVPDVKVTGHIRWRGEDFDDIGTLYLDDNYLVHADKGVFN